MEEFSFGTLATDKERLEQVKSQRKGLSHLYRVDPLTPTPNEPVTITSQSGSDIHVTSMVCRYTTDGSKPGSGIAKEVSFKQVCIDWDTLNWGYLTTWETQLPPQPENTLVRYQIEAALAADGSRVLADGIDSFSYVIDKYPKPEWIHSTIIYQIFVDRFWPGENSSWLPSQNPADFHGGTLRGITEKLDYIEELGVNCIWLSPIFPSPSHHGYNATDLFSLEPRIGTLEDLKELVTRAHERGIRILLDFVANHISDKHPIFQDAYSNKESPYYDWFTWLEWPNEYQTFFGVQELPELNLNNPDARQYIIDAAVYWINECQIDGFRLDFAHGPDLDFWSAFRHATKRANPDIWLFGEVIETAELQKAFDGKLDGTLDFLLIQALRGAFAFGSWDMEKFDAFLASHESFFDKGFSRPSFLDNHDTNRFLWVVKGNTSKLQVAALCQFTLSGPPITYYGTEVGLSQDREIWREDGGFLEESRLPMLWDGEQDKSLLDYYRMLVRFRKAHPVLLKGDRKTLHVNAGKGTYAYSRKDESEELIVVLNNSDNARAVTIETDLQEDLINHRSYPRKNGIVEIELDPYSGAVLGKALANS